MTVSGDFTHSGGTFTHNSGTVTLDGTNQTISGSTTFNHLSKTETTNDATDSILTFAAGTTQTILGLLTLDGLDADDRINLVSTTPGTQWRIDPQGARTIDYLDVQDSFNINSSRIQAMGTNSVNSGNNSGWSFVAPANFTWIGDGVDTNWLTTANWQGGVVPGAANTAIFDGNSSKNAAINTNANVAGLQINTGYKGTVTQGAANTVTVGTSNYSQADGTFTGSSAAIAMNGAFTLSGGTFTSTSGTLTDIGNWTVTGGTFNHNSGTVQFFNAIGQSLTLTGSHALNNVTIGGNFYTNALTIAGGTTLTVNGTLNFAAAYGGSSQPVIFNGGTIAAKGDILQAIWGATGTTAVTISGTGAQTFTGGGAAAYMLPVTINKPSGTLTLAGTISTGSDWTYTAGMLDAGTSTLQFFNAISQSLTLTGSHALNNVTIGGNFYTNALTIAGGTTLTVNGTLNFAAAYGGSSQPVIFNGGTIAAKGDILQAIWGATGTTAVTISGTGAQTFTGGGAAAYMLPVTINKPSGTLTLAGTISTGSDWTYTAGMLDAGTSTLQFFNAISQSLTLTGSHALNNVTIGGNFHTNALTIAGGTTLTVNGTLNFAGAWAGSFNPVIFNGGTIAAKGDILQAIWGATGTTAVTISGTGAQTWSTSGGQIPGSVVTVNKSSGTVTLGSNVSVNTAGQNLSITSGTLDLAGYNLTVNNVLTVDAAGTLQLQGAETITAGSLTLSAGSTVRYNGTAASYTLKNYAYSNLTIDGGAATVFSSPGALTVAGALNVTSGTYNANGQTTTVTGLATVNGGSYTAGSAAQTFNGGLTVSSGTFTGSTGTVDVNGNVTISGTGVLIAPAAAGAFTVSGNFAHTAGTFTHNSGTLTLDGTNQTLSGSTTFNHLSKTETTNNATDSILTFAAGATQTIVGTLTLAGLDADDRINLVSSTPASQWQIDAQSTRFLGFLDVQDSNNINSALMNGFTSSVNSGNNTGWNFVAPAAFTWIGEGVDTSWLTTANWQGGVVPGAGNSPIFDATSSRDSLVVAGFAGEIGNLSINTGYTGTLTLARSLTLYGNYTQAAGTFNVGSSAMNVAGDFILSGGTFNASSGTTTFNGNFTHTAGGTFNHNSGTVFFNPGGGVSRTIDVNSTETFNNFTLDAGYLYTTNGDALIVDGTLSIISPAATLEVVSGSSVTVNGTTALTDGFVGYAGSTGTLQANGSVSVASGFDGGAGIVVVGGSGDQSFTIPNGAVFPGLTLNSANTTVNFAAGASAAIAGNFTLQAGTFTASSGTTTFNGNFTHTAGGTFNHNSGTVLFAPGDSVSRIIDVNSTETFNNFTMGSGYVYTSNGDELIVNGTLLTTSPSGTLEVVSGSTVTVNGTTALTDGFVGYNGSTGTLQVKGDVTIASTFDGGSGTQITFSGGNVQTYTDNGGVKTSGPVTVNKTVGTALTLATDMTYNSAGQNLTITSGTFDLAGHNLTVNNILTLGSSGTLQLQGAETITAGTVTLNAGSTFRYYGRNIAENLTVKDFGATDYSNLTINDTNVAKATFQSAAAKVVTGVLNVTSGTYDANGQTTTVTGLATVNGGTHTAGSATQTFNGGLTVSSGTLTGSTGTVDVNGTVTISGTGVLIAPAAAGSFTVSGNFAHTAGTFTHNSGTVTLDGTNQTLSGATTFNNLTKTVASADTLTLPSGAGNTQTIAGTLTLRGASGQLLSLRSDVPATQAQIDPQGTRLIGFLDVQDSYNINSALMNGFTSSVNSGNNTGWNFVAPAAFTWIGEGVDTSWLTTANWQGGVVPGAGNSPIFDATSSRDSLVVAGFAGTIANLSINTGYTGTITLGRSLTINSAFTQAAGTFNGGSSPMTTGTFTLSGGTFTSTSGTLTVSNDWTHIAGGTFTHNNGTVVSGFTALNPTWDVAGTETFNNFTMDKINRSLTITSGDTLIVGGTFTHSNGAILTGSIQAQGAVIVGVGAQGGTATVQVTSAGAQTIEGNGGRLPSLQVSKPSGTLSLGTTNIGVTNLTIDAGNTLSSTTGTLTVTTGNWTNIAGGTFQHNNGTVVADGENGTWDVNGTETFNNLAVNKVNRTLTITSGDTLIVGGTFTHTAGFINTGTIEAQGAVAVGAGAQGGTSTIQVTSAGAQTIEGNGGLLPTLRVSKASGTLSLGTTDIRVTNLIIDAGNTLSSTTGTLTVTDAWTNTAGGTFQHNNGTVVSGFTALNPTWDVAGTETFNNFTMDKINRSLTIASGDTLIVGGTFTHTAGFINTGTIEAQGAVAVGAGALGGTALLSFTGTANQTYTQAGDAIDGLVTVNKASGTVTLASAATWNAAGQNLTVTSGTLDVAGFALSTGTLTVAAAGTVQLQGAETITAGTVTLNAGSTVRYNGAAAAYTLKNYAYSNLTIDGGAATVFSFPANLTSIATLTLNNSITSLAGFNLTATTLVNNAMLRLQGNETVTITTMDVDSGTVQYVGRNIAENLAIKDFGATDYYNLVINDTNVSKATFQSGAAKVIAGALTVTSGTYDANGLTSTVTGLTTVTGGTYTAGSATQTFNGGLTVSSGTFTGSAGTVDVNGNVTISGTGVLIAPAAAGSFTVSGNFAHTAGTFTHNSGTVTLDGTNQTLSGATTFNNLTKTVASADTLTLPSGASNTQTITGTLTLRGVSGQLLSLRSDVPGAQAQIDPQGTRLIGFLDVQDSYNINSALMNGFTSSVNSGNNTGWNFVAPAAFTWIGEGVDTNWITIANWQGGVVPGAGNTPIFDGTSSRNSTVDAGFAGTIGNLNINTGYTGTIDLARSLTINSAFTQAAGTFNGGSSAMSVGNFTLSGGTFTSTSGTLTVAGDWTHTAGGTFTHNNGTVVASGGTNVFWDVAGAETFNNLTVNKQSGGWQLFITAGDTLIVGGTFTHTDGVIHTGTIQAQGAVVVGAGADGGSGTIQITSAGAQTIEGNGGMLPSLQVSKPSGTLSLGTTNITVNNLTIDAGNTLSSTTGTLTVDGDWTNTAGGTFQHNNGTVVASGFNVLWDVNGTETFNNLTVNKQSGGWQLFIAAGDTLIVGGTFTHTDGVIHTGTIQAQGAVVVGAGADGGSGTIQITSAGAQTIEGNGGMLPSLQVSKPSGTLSLGTTNITVNNLTIDAGNTLSSTTGTLTVGGDWTNTAGGTFQHNNGTVVASGFNVLWDVNGTETFNNFTVARISGWQLFIASGDTLIVGDTFTHTDGLIHTGTIATQGAVTIGALADGGTALLSFTGTANQTYTQVGDVVDGLITVNKASGTVTLASAATWNAASQNLMVTSGTLDLAGFALSTGTLTVGAAGTVQLQGAETITAGTVTLNAGSTVRYNGTGAAYTLKNYAYSNLTIDGGAATVFSFPANLTSINTLTLNNSITSLAGFNLTATTLANNATLRLQGNETVTITTMDTDSGLVEYVGDGAAGLNSFTIKDFGATDYYNLRIAGLSGSETFTVSSPLKLNGSLTHATGILNVGANVTTAGGTITSTDAVTLSANALIDTTDAGGSPAGANMTFSSTLNGGQAVVLTAGAGSVSIGGVVGGATRLTSLTASGTTIALQAVNTTGAQSYSGTTTLNGNLNSNTAGAITVTGAANLATGPITVQTAGLLVTDDITFTSTINGGQALTLAAGTGDVLVGGTVGGTTPLSSMTASGNTIGVQAVTTAGAGAITFTSSGIGASDDLTINGALTAGSGAITLTSGKSVALGANVSTTGNVLITAGTAITRSAGTVSGGGVLLDAATGIGSVGAPITTAATTLAGRATSSGGIFVTEADALDIGTVNGISGLTTLSGAMTLTAAGDVSVTQAISAGGLGAVTLTASGGSLTGAGGVSTGGDLTISGASVGSTATPLMLGTIGGTLNGTVNGGGATDSYNVKALALTTLNLGVITAIGPVVGVPVTIDATGGSILHGDAGTDITGGRVNFWGGTIGALNFDLEVITDNPPVMCNGSPCGLPYFVNGASALYNQLLVGNGLSQSGRYLLGALPEEGTLLTAGVLPDYIYRCLDQDRQAVVCTAGAVWHDDDGTDGALSAELGPANEPTHAVAKASAPSISPSRPGSAKTERSPMVPTASR